MPELNIDWTAIEKHTRELMESRGAKYADVPKDMINRLEMAVSQLRYIRYEHTGRGDYPQHPSQWDVYQSDSEEWDHNTWTKYTQDISDYHSSDRTHVWRLQAQMGKIAGMLEIIFSYLCENGKMVDNYTVDCNDGLAWDRYGDYYDRSITE